MKSVKKSGTEVYAKTPSASKPIGGDEAKIKRAIDLQESIKVQSKELELLKEYFIKKLGKKTEEKIVTSSGTAIMKKTNSYKLRPEFIPKLIKKFGDRWADFINEKTSYGMTPALRGLLSNGDHKHAELVREATEITVSQSVQFIPLSKN